MLDVMPCSRPPGFPAKMEEPVPIRPKTPATKVAAGNKKDRHGERTRDIAGKRTSSDKTPFASRKKTAPIHGDRQERAGIAGATADSRPRARSICDLSVLSDLRSPTLGRPSFALCAKPRAKPQGER